MVEESKVVYLDGERQRVIRGVVTIPETGDFVKVERRDGTILIKKGNVLRVETWKEKTK